MIRSTRAVSWIKAALREFETFPDGVRSTCLTEKTEGGAAMKSENLEVVRGSGNVFRDLGHKNADADLFKAILAAEIIKALDRDGLSVRGAQGRTGIAAADFSRIRNADLGRFTVDRLMSIINRLGSRVEVKIKVRRAEKIEHGMPA
jgi:predicted XRE-type DNA-binding protein